MAGRKLGIRSNEVMKQCNEALNASLLQFFCQFHCFIALNSCFNWCFIASLLSEFASLALNLYQQKKNIKAMKRWVILKFFFKSLYSGKISVAKLTKIVFFAFTEVFKSLVLLYGEWGINLKSVDGNEVIKLDNKGLNSSSFKFFRSVQCFIATIFTQSLTNRFIA
jgi:hypothetical protein